MTAKRKFKGASIYTFTWLAFTKKKDIKNYPDEPLERIVEDIARIFEVNVEDIKGRSRKTKFVLCRQLFCYIAGKMSKLPIEKIGIFIGFNNDSKNAHTSVMHSVRKFENGINFEDEKIFNFYLKYIKETKIFKLK